MEELLTLKSLLLQGDISGALEEGIYETTQLENLVNKEEILLRALTSISPVF